MIGDLPIGWMVAYDELVLCVVEIIIVFFCWARLSVRFGLNVDQSWVFWTDALGLGVFTAVGSQKAELRGLNLGAVQASEQITHKQTIVLLSCRRVCNLWHVNGVFWRINPRRALPVAPAHLVFQL